MSLQVVDEGGASPTDALTPTDARSPTDVRRLLRAVEAHPPGVRADLHADDARPKLRRDAPIGSGDLGATQTRAKGLDRRPQRLRGFRDRQHQWNAGALGMAVRVPSPASGRGG